MKLQVGDFELNLNAAQLRGPSSNVFLAEQPFRILSLLLKRPGQVVTRLEIQRELWPDGTVVEFDHSINVAVRRLREAFGESATTRKYVETVRGRGYRLAAHISSHIGEGCAPTANLSIESMVVIPFTSEKNDPEAEFFSDRITESIINKLTQLAHLRVISRATTFRYKRRNIDNLSLYRDLSVQGIVMGRVALRKKKVVVGAELIDARTDFQLWGARYRRSASDLCSVQRQIACEICRSIGDQLVEGRRGPAGPAPDGQSANA